ncbi:MAG: SelB C-terminal domain-containing protein, partial [Deltaproteobacteria bacterium]|nr:SelB C-terminal domain-containing protein [Deltaproteobacteria bacterium]
VEEKTGLSTLKLGVHNGRLVRVKDDLYYTPESIAKIEDQLRGYLQEKERITVIEFKDLAAVTRGHAVALLEHFDTIRVTLRLDDHRVLR